MNKFQEMVRARLREKTPNYSVLAAYLKATDPSVIQKRLKEGGTNLNLAWLDEVSGFYQMSVSEMCAMVNSAWQEVKPLEAELLLLFRGMTELQRHSLLSILNRSEGQPEKRRKPRAGYKPLTEEQQLVIDLYARSEPKAREGVLKVLRETAKRGTLDQISGTTE